MLRPSLRAALALLVASALALTGCAGLRSSDPVRLNVVGIEPIEGEGLEMRMAVRLRVQNPNDTSIDYDGISVELDLNNRPFATGVSPARGSIPRFGETVLNVPVSVSAFSVMRQAWGIVGGMSGASAGAAMEPIPYVLRGKLGGSFGSTRFLDRGALSLPELR
ncbi:LEA type 2 family protein [Pigmentiphaga litoralis]|uniref:LEA type 2 family protein n=1 Tax=Pigmentiphaga litoralis TaxID=516702 RepID=UPI003B42F8B1